jgi:hypothetical protein
MGGECSTYRRHDKYEKNFSQKYEVSSLHGDKRFLSSSNRRTRFWSGGGGPPLKIENVTINLKRSYFYLVLRIRMKGAVPPPSLMPSRLTKGTLQIAREYVEMTFPRAVARPLWLLLHVWFCNTQTILGYHKLNGTAMEPTAITAAYPVNTHTL